MKPDGSQFMPIALEDEYFLSYLWRWAHLGGSVTFRRGIRSLVGSAPATIPDMLTPLFLAKVVNQLPNHRKANAFLILTQEKYLSVLGVVNDMGEQFRPEAKTLAGDFRVKHLRWCEACAREDAAEYGLSFWRNSHQDFRLKRCQRHGTTLLATCHLCKRKGAKSSQFAQPPKTATCQYCSTPVTVEYVNDLTPFQKWLEQLHHLGNHGVQVDRKALLSRVDNIIAAEQLKQSEGLQNPQRRFIEAFNSTKACEHFSCGEVTYEMLSSYTNLKIGSVLDPKKDHSSVMLALLGWVFLSKEERSQQFGTFSGGQAIQGLA